MSVHYRGNVPERNFTIHDFHANGITLTSFQMYRNHKSNKRHIRCVFRSHGFTGIIRTTCYENSFAVDVIYGKQCDLYPNDSCLTTECKTLREAKSILFVWFRENGFKCSPTTKVLPSVKFKYFQGTVSPFLL